MDSRAYCGRFSPDGSLFACGFQDRVARVYDVEEGFKIVKEIHCRNLRWTVTDAVIAPDLRRVLFSH